MILKIHPDNPQARNIASAVEIIKNGGLVIYPTDTIYGIGCDIYNTEGIEKIARLKGIDVKKAQFSFICSDLSHLSDFAKSVDTPIFRMLKAALPGPYTFILEASKEVPKILKTKKDTVGIRVPDNKICNELVKLLGHPIMSASLPMPAEYVEYFTDPEVIHEQFGKIVECVVDGGIGGIIPSTIIDCTDAKPVLVRAGKGPWEHLIN